MLSPERPWGQEKKKMQYKMPVIDMDKTGQNIKDLRKKTGMSVKELQKMFGFETPQAIYKWQHGTALPSVDNLLVLSVVFQVSINDILVTCG